MTLQQAEAALKKALAISGPAEDKRKAAHAAYMADPEIVAAFVLMKRKQQEHGVTSADAEWKEAMRETDKWWARVDRLLPDPDYGL